MPKSCLTPAAFLALPQSEKAIIVAKDTIAQIRTKSITVKSGVYLADLPPFDEFNDNEISTASAKGKRLIKESGCTACAKSSLFLSAIMRSNKMSLEDLVNKHDESDMTRKVCNSDKIFTRSNFHLIEIAFECEHFGHIGNSISMNTEQDAKEFGKLFGRSNSWNDEGDLIESKDDDIRLVAICLNIIANNGEFIPTKNIPTQKDIKNALRSHKKKTC